MKRLVRSVVRAIGLDLVRYQPPSDTTPFPADLSDNDRAVLGRITGYSMTSIERQIALIQAVRYLVMRGIDGCLVECGVWRGGSSMAAALTLAQEGEADRHLYLYDTFEGMTPPTNADMMEAHEACTRSARNGRPSVPLLPIVKPRISVRSSTPSV